MNPLRLALTAALVATLGCGKDEYVSEMAERVKAQEEVVAILRAIKDEAGMEKAYEALANKYRRLGDMKQMRPPSGEVRERLAKEFGPRLQAIMQDTLGEIRRVQALPGGGEFFKKLDQLKRDHPGTTP